MIFNKSIIAGQKGKEAKQVTCCRSFAVSVFVVQFARFRADHVAGKTAGEARNCLREPEKLR